MAKRKILFVCMGNICRSPAGEGVFRKVVADRGLAHAIDVDSAGTIGYHTGEPPDPRMRKAASRRGYRLDSLARQIQPRDLDRFDLIIAMDRDNLRDIRSMDPSKRHREKIHLLCDFVPDCPTQDVPDPYYGGTAGFEAVLDLIEQAAEGILYHLQTGDGAAPDSPANPKE